MEGFFKREWKAFLNDMQEIGEFFIGDGEEKVHFDSVEKPDGFFKREWKAFLDDMRGLGEMVMAAFEDDPVLKLCAPKEDRVLDCDNGAEQVGFFKNEWQLFKQDIAQADEELSNLFGLQKKNVTEEIPVACFEEPTYIKDEVDVKLETYLEEPVEELMENVCGEKTQHAILREYATFFKPYTEQAEMCQVAFKKYYDRHALKMAVNEFPVEQARIVQNNVDVFIKGQEIFGQGGQFIDSRVDGIFDKVGIGEVNKMVGILSDSVTDGKNIQGERILAEAMSYMVDNGIKVEKNGTLLQPVKKSLEAKLDDVHNSLRTHEDWNEDYQSLLSQERKYLYALNRIEQFETEQRIAEFESKLNDLDVIV
ncbi:MAG: hypothetical protein IKV94_05540 [Clostridia bacterium]|nr:hypothetical protein [Clostridia bacterium]